MTGVLVIDFEYIYEKMGLTLFKDDEFALEVYPKVNEKLSDIITDEKNRKEMLGNLDFMIEIADDPSSFFNFRKYVRNNLPNNQLFRDCKSTIIRGAFSDVITFINNNPELKNAEIVYDTELELNKDTLEQIKLYFGNIPSMKFRIKGNSQAISLDEYEKTVYAINDIVSKVKKYDYSPMEQLMYSYDLVRDRFYVKEDENEEEYVSRDLSSALLGDKIVCVGFANIYNEVVSLLGFGSRVFYLVDEERCIGHVRNLIYVDDSKYDINGLYFFDPTFDCKKSENNYFLMEYMFFAKTYREMECYCKEKSYTPITYQYFDISKLNELVESTNVDDPSLTEYVSLRGKVKIDSMKQLLGGRNILEGETFDNAVEETIAFVEVLGELADKPIAVDKFLKILYTVRKNQYYENPKKYVFDIDALTSILVNSRFSAFDTPVERFSALFGISNGITTVKAKAKVREFVNDNNVEQDIERVRLIRLLRSVLENKTNEEVKKLEKKL